MTKLVSILMPLYNAEKWLAQTIESVLAQTYFNWELIIVDDGSTDNSYEIAQSFAKKDNRIKVYKQKNKGACAARNKAFELSKGEYIQYLDADDLLSKNKIELQLKALEKANDSNAIANCSWGKFQKKIGDIKGSKQLIDKSYDEPLNWLIDSWLKGGHGAIMAWLTPRHLIEKAGKWNESLTVNQDGEFFCRVLLQASQIVFVDEVKVFYRMDNPNSISQSKHFYGKAKSLLSSYQMYFEHLNKELENEEVQTALAANFMKFIAQYNHLYDSLSFEAKMFIHKLPKANKSLILKKWFHPISRIIGFDVYLYLKGLISELKRSA